MTRLPPSHPLHRVVAVNLGADREADFRMERLRASRPVFRFFLDEDGAALVGKFFRDQVPATPLDRSLAQEYHHYLEAESLGLAAAGLIPRLLGRAPEVRLWLLLEGLPGPDLDHFLGEAVHRGDMQTCLEKVSGLAALLAFFHSRPAPPEPAAFEPVFAYFQKVQVQLASLGLLSPAEKEGFSAAGRRWAERWAEFPDWQVLLHGDATPTNFLFPNGRVAAVDLERLRFGDRLFDLSWVAGEIRHAWGWRGRKFADSEPVIQAFFKAYLQALPGGDRLETRIYALNPLYMALAEMRIARNSYLPWKYRRALVAEACRCLGHSWREP